MRKMLPIRQKLARLRRNESGLALTEFALSLPILLTLSITFMEFSSYVNAYMRVSQIALSVADNTGRIRQSIDVTDVDAAMIGARIAGESINLGPNGRVIVSMIEDNGETGDDAGQQITWQRCFGAKNVPSSYGNELDGDTDDEFEDGFGPEGNKIMATPEDGLMFVEISYDYDPIFPVGNAMIGNLGGKTIHATAAYPVRERESNELTNGDNNPPEKQRLCSDFTAT
jgi:hypothetical protein